MIQLLAAATLEDIEKAVGLLTGKIDTLIELLKGTQGNTQYYIAGVVSVTLISAIGVLWTALGNKETATQKKLEDQQSGHAEVVKELVQEIREGGRDVISAHESRATALLEASKLISDNTESIRLLQTAVEKIQPPGAAPV